MDKAHRQRGTGILPVQRHGLEAHATPVMARASRHTGFGASATCPSRTRGLQTDTTPRPCWPALVSVTVSALLLAAPAGYAHKLKLFAGAEGRTVTGYAYFPGGGRARNQTVRVLAPDGRELGETTTNDKGEFAFEAAWRCDHTFVIRTADGHKADYTVSAEELPERLPGLGESAESTAEARVTDLPSMHEGRSATAQPQAPPAPQQSDLEAVVERIVARGLRPLREDIERYEDKTRLHDILGGIGYIVGITGILFYVLGRTRNKAPGKASG